MNNTISYQLEWNVGVGPTWHHSFHMHSDTMAREYVERLVASNKELRGATRIQLWNMDAQRSVVYGEVHTQSTIRARV